MIRRFSHIIKTLRFTYIHCVKIVRVDAAPLHRYVNLIWRNIYHSYIRMMNE